MSKKTHTPLSFKIVDEAEAPVKERQYKTSDYAEVLGALVALKPKKRVTLSLNGQTAVKMNQRITSAIRNNDIEAPEGYSFCKREGVNAKGETNGTLVIFLGPKRNNGKRKAKAAAK